MAAHPQRPQHVLTINPKPTRGRCRVQPLVRRLFKRSSSGLVVTNHQHGAEVVVLAAGAFQILVRLPSQINQEPYLLVSVLGFGEAEQVSAAVEAIAQKALGRF